MLRGKRYLGVLLALASVFALVGAVACGGGETEIVEVQKIVEVEKEVPVEVIKEVEVEKEVLVVVEKEVPVEVEKVVEVVVEKIVEVEKVVEVVKVVEVEKEVLVKEFVPVDVVEVVKVSSFVETREGIPHTIRGPAAISALPTTFNEAPMLAARVRAGDLPPVEERLPKQPLMIKPAHEIGQYGGTLRTEGATPWVGLHQGKPLFFDEESTNPIPWAFKDWEFSNGNKTVTFFLREGLRFSDGVPFTADDIIFWYEDIFLNDELTPNKQDIWRVGLTDKEGVWEKVDDFTVKVTFEIRYEMFPGWLGTNAAGGDWQQGLSNRVIVPAHYLKQFHPKYADGGQAAVDAMAEEAGFDDWVPFFRMRGSPASEDNLGFPVVSPWMLESRGEQSAVLVRNPYFYAIDVEGNQLPYIDRISSSAAGDVEVAALRAIAGEYDYYRMDSVAKVPLFLENRSVGDYEVYLWNGFGDSEADLFWNQNWVGDAEIERLVQNRDFRIALSVGINREEINQIIWHGLGEPASIVPLRGQFATGRKWFKIHTEFDPPQANALLDALGLDQKDSDGFRLRADNGERLTIKLTQAGGPWAGLSMGLVNEIMSEHWARNIGVDVNVDPVGSSDFWRIGGANEAHLFMWVGQSGAAHFAPHAALPFNPTASWGNQWAHWWGSGGTTGIEPSCTSGPQPAGCDAKFGFDAFRTVKQSLVEGVPLMAEIVRRVADNVYVMGIIGNSPAFFGMHLASNRVGNVRTSASHLESTTAIPPRKSYPLQWYLKE